MGKSLRYGSHNFPASAGFTGSTGKSQLIKSYSRKAPRAGGFKAPKPSLNPVEVSSSEMAPKGRFASTKAPSMGSPPVKPKLSAPSAAVDPGTSMQSGRSRKVTQQDVLTGSAAPIRPGYRKGGMVGKC